VLHVPWQERLDFAIRVGLRIGWQIWAGIPRALFRAFRSSPRDYISDARFNEVMTSSCYEKFLTEGLSAAQKQDFAPYLSGSTARFYKSDFTAIGGVRPYDGMYVSPTVSLISDDNGTRKVVAVKVGDVVVDPTCGGAWESAKYFVFQGAAYSMLFTEHPNLHFPYDTINAVTKSSVPTDHLIFRFLSKHLRFQLQLNKLVLESKWSVITNFRPTHYAPFTANLDDGLLDFFVAGYRGVEGNNAYPPYSFRARPKKVHGDYGEFQRAYYEPMLKLAKKIADEIPEGDEFTRRWATYINMWIPGFPSGEEIFEGDTLAEVLAGIVWDMTLGHAVDHQAFSFDVSVAEKYLRLRVPPPLSKDSPAVDPTSVNTWWDRFKAEVAHRAFFQPNTVTRLINVRYDFGNAALDRAGQEFIESLPEVERQLKVPKYISLHEIPASIQY